MLTHPTLKKLYSLRLNGMARAFEQQQTMPAIDSLSTEERLDLMVDHEITERDSRRLTPQLRRAKFRHGAVVEDIDYQHPRALDKAVVTNLSSCQWVREHHTLLLTGPTGIGKSWLACAFGHQAGRQGLNVM